MQAAFELTEGQKNLERILEERPEESKFWNEAQNRFQFVDRLMTECLGWIKPDIDVEQSDEGGGKSDYVLGDPAKAVLEAKKEAIQFDFPPSGSPARVRKMQPLIQSSKPFGNAATQVIPYCAFKGAQIAIVCNGPQLVIFQALSSGQPPLEGECFLFDGFASYVEHFPILWKLLSPEGVAENRAFRDLALHRNPRIPPKASTAIPEPTKYRYRSEFQENLRLLSSFLLEEIEDNPDLKSTFYKECYVAIEANNRHLLLSKQIISTRYRRAGDDSIAPSAFGSIVQTDERGQLELKGAAGSGSRPIVVLGDVGVGKTSFFENLYENLDSGEKANTFFIHIDLGKKANLTADVKSFVLDEIPNVLKEKYGVDIDDFEFVEAIYGLDLKGFDASVKGQFKKIDKKRYDKERISFLSKKVEKQGAHLEASLRHLARGRKKQIILVMDNADQRLLDVQQEAFLIAQELAATRDLLVFVALRPSTFYHSKTTGALSGYKNKILTISPPPADEVVKKRIVFAVRVAEGKENVRVLAGIQLQIGSIVTFLTATLRSIRANDAIKQFLSNISGGNTRAVIELITSFCGSPNVDSEKIVQIEERTGKYVVPLHEFTKHALLGDYAYFNSQSSFLAENVFDVSTSDPREHFLPSLIIAYLSSNMGIPNSDGFVSGEIIMKELMRCGFFEDQIRNSLRRLAAKRLIETPHAQFREIPVPDDINPETYYFRATSVGIYHVKFWIGSFSFLDATSTDTPIFEEALRDDVTKLASSFKIGDRYKKTCVFRDYLENQWHLANFDVTYYDFAEHLKSQKPSFESVSRVAQRLAV